jgi:hypothetical protein
MNWTKWHWDCIFSAHISFALPVSFHQCFIRIFIYSCSYQKNKKAKPGCLPDSNGLSKFREHWIEKYAERPESKKEFFTKYLSCSMFVPTLSYFTHSPRKSRHLSYRENSFCMPSSLKLAAKPLSQPSKAYFVSRPLLTLWPAKNS